MSLIKLDKAIAMQLEIIFLGPTSLRWEQISDLPGRFSSLVIETLV
jgi:hypothetical protein